MRTGQKGKNSSRRFRVSDADRHSAGSRLRYALNTAALSGLAASLLISLWLIGAWMIGSLQQLGIDLPEIEVLRAREEADYDENDGPQLGQLEPFVLLLGPGEEPPLRPLDLGIRINPGVPNLQAPDADAAARDRIDPILDRQGPAGEGGPGDDEPLAEGGPGDDEPLAEGGPGDDEPLGDGGGAQVREDEGGRFGRDFVPNERGLAGRAGNIPAGEDLLDGKWLRMRLQTNYVNPGVLVFSSGGTFLTTQTIHPEGQATTPRDPTSGLFNVAVDLNVDWLQAALDDIDLLTPDMGILSLDVSLHSSTTGARIAGGSWSGHVRGLPWMNFSADLPEPGNAAPKLGRKKGPRQAIGLLEAAMRRRQRVRVRTELHPRSGDSFYFLIGSSSRHDLVRAPGDNFEFLRNVEVLSTGRIPGLNSNLEFHLDSPSTNRTAVPYVALWSYHIDRGWARSRVYLVP